MRPAQKPPPANELPKRVVIADDELSFRILVSAAIASDRCEVLEASSGSDALALIRRTAPHVALLDIGMAGLNGLEITRAIRADPRLGHTKVILLSGRTQQSEIAQGMSAGADRYLTKPFSPMELLSVVEEALELP